MSKWGHTHVKIAKSTYTWAISNFSYLRKKTGEELESPCFSIGSDLEVKWCLKLYVNGINENFKDYISVYLFQKFGGEHKTEGEYAISILDGKKDKFLEMKDEYQYNKNFTSWGFPAFAKIEELREKHNGFLTEDTLTLRCEITTILGYVHVSSEESTSEIDRKRPTGPARCLENLFLDERFSDVKLVAPCGRSLPAHKNILTATSPIFSAMFQHDMVESQQNQVEIDDLEYEVLKELLRFVYTGRVENGEQTACQLLTAADKYGIEQLKLVCEGILCDVMSVENVVDILAISERHNVAHLHKLAVTFLRARIKSVVETTAFKSIAQTDLLADIIRQVILQDNPS